MDLFIFKPAYHKRVWGGQQLKDVFQRPIAFGEPIGESWELIDHPDFSSEVVGGDASILTINDLWKEQRTAVFGSDAPDTPHFPLQIKLLDCTESLSLQVQPPKPKETTAKAWYFIKSDLQSPVYSGVKKGATKTALESALKSQQPESLVHSIFPREDDIIYIPAGRIHGAGAKHLIFEVRENHQPALRLWDWNRQHGCPSEKPRELQSAQALEAIRYTDREPFLTQPHGETLLCCPSFTMRRAQLFPDEVRTWYSDHKSFQFHFVTKGSANIGGKDFTPGHSCLIPASTKNYDITPGPEGVDLLSVLWGKS